MGERQDRRGDKASGTLAKMNTVRTICGCCSAFSREGAEVHWLKKAVGSTKEMDEGRHDGWDRGVFLGERDAPRTRTAAQCTGD